MIRWHRWCSARATCLAIFACCGRFALISCQELASGGETFGSRPVPFGTCSAAYTPYSCTPVLHESRARDRAGVGQPAIGPYIKQTSAELALGTTGPNPDPEGLIFGVLSNFSQSGSTVYLSSAPGVSSASQPRSPCTSWGPHEREKDVRPPAMV